MKKNLHILFLMIASLSVVNTCGFASFDNGSGGQSACQFNYGILPISGFEICYDQKSNVLLVVGVENIGNDTLSNLSLEWYVDVARSGTGIIGDPISPGSTGQFSLPELAFPNEGSYTVSVKVSASCNGNVAQTDSITLNLIVLSPFEINVLKDTTVCSNIPLPVRVSSGLGDYVWNNGAISNQVIAAQVGKYSVTVTDEFGCSAVDSMILNHFEVSDDLVGDTILCDGFVLTSDIGDEFESYLWSDGSISQNIQISTDGLYSITVNDSNGCQIVDSMMVGFAALPQTGIPPQISVCSGDTTVIGAASSFYSYNWNTGDTTSSIPIYTSGTYIITVVGNLGCIGIDTVSVSIMPLPDPVFSDSVMCNNVSYVMDVGQWYPTVQWSTGDTTQNILVSSPGLYTVSITDLDGCHSEKSVNIVNTNISVNLGQDRVICTGNPLFLVPSGIFDAYLWTDGSTGTNINVSVSGTYGVTVATMGCVAYDEVNVSVEDYPVPDFTFQILSPDVEFTNTSNPSYNFVWSFGDNDSSTVLNPQHQYMSNGTFTVVLEVENSCGKVQKTVDIGIHPQGAQNIYLNNDLSIYPTLATNQINFTLNGLNDNVIEYAVFDVVGRLLYSNSTTYHGADYVYQIDVTTYSSGTYYLRIMNEDALVAVKPFVKQR